MIYYLDLLSGDNANPGTDPSAPRRDFVPFSSYSAGDSFRIKKSPPVQVTGLSATWADKSRNVSWDGEVCISLSSCDSGFVSNGASWSVSYDTSTRKEGTAALKLTLNNTTAGEMAYFNFPAALNGSGYTHLSLWFRISASIPVGALKIKLCAGLNGASPVAEYTLAHYRGNDAESITAASRFHALVLPLSSGSTNGTLLSLSISTNGAIPSGTSLWFDNLCLCKDPSAPDGINLASLIGMPASFDSGHPDASPTMGWFPINSLSPSGCVLDAHADIPALGTKGYAGPSGTFPLYKRECLPVNYSAIAQQTTTYFFQSRSQGTAASRVCLSFGWNDDFSAQDGYTFLRAGNGQGSGFYLNHDYHDIERAIGVRFYTAHDARAKHLRLREVGGIACSYYGVYLSNAFNVDCSALCANNGNYALYYSGGLGARIRLGYASNNTNQPLSIGQPITIEGLPGCVAFNTGIAATTIGGGFRDITFYANGNTPISSLNYARRCSFPEGLGTAPLDGYDYGIASLDHNATPGWHLIVRDGGQMETVQAASRSGAAWSWRLYVTSTSRSAAYPLKFRAARLAYKQGQPLSVSLWVKRSNTALSVQFGAFGGQMKGLNADSFVSASALAGEWEQLSLSFTPTETGTGEVHVLAWGGTTHYVDVDDLTVSGAISADDKLLKSMNLVGEDYNLVPIPLLAGGGASISPIIVIDD